MTFSGQGEEGESRGGKGGKGKGQGGEDEGSENNLLNSFDRYNGMTIGGEEG